MNNEKTSKQEMEQLKKQFVANNKLLSDERQKVVLQQSEIKALHQIRDGLRAKIEQQKKQLIQLENELKAFKVPPIQKQKSLTRSISPQPTQLAKVLTIPKMSKSLSPFPPNTNDNVKRINPKLSGNKRKRNVVNDDDDGNINENKMSTEPPFKRYKANIGHIASKEMNTSKDSQSNVDVSSVDNVNKNEEETEKK